MLTIPELEEACAKGLRITRGPDTYARMDFPLTRRLYPLGFPVDICSNSETVLDLASESWSAFTSMFSTEPIRIEIAVLPGSTDECPPPTTCRAQRHLLTMVADRENHGVYDLSRGFTRLWLTEQALRYPGYVRYFFLQAAVMSQISTRFVAGVHGACVERNGAGVMLCGDSGAGKSTLSYACARAGWAYVNDDSCSIVHHRSDRLAVGHCHQVRFRPSSVAFFPEIGSQEITQRAEVGKPSIEMSPAELGIQISQSANIEYIVFLNRREGKNEILRPYSKEVARQFMHQGRFLPEEMLVPHYESVERVLAADVLELRYQDLDWALEQLTTLVEGR